LIGAILAAVMLKRTYGDKATKWQQAGSIVGLILIVFTLFSLDGQSSFPGWNALAPTVGAALMIGCGPQTLTARRIFSLRAIVWVGLISFPLYLWHWPLLTFARIISSAMPTAQVRIGAVVLSVVLSWATYRLIEKPLRFHPRVKVITGALVASMVVIGLVGYVTFRNDGIASREVTQMNPDINSGEEGGAQGWVQDTCGISDAKVADLFASCLEDNRETPRFALIGDSKAEALIGGFIRTSTENGRWLFMGGNSDSGVPVPLISDAPEFERFQKLARIAVDSVASNPDIDVVVLEGAIRAMFGIADETSFVQVPESLYYDIVTEGFRNSITILTQAGKKVVLYIDNPPLPNPEDCLQRKTTIGILNRLLVNPNPLCEMPIQTFIDQTAKYYLMFEQLKREFPGQVDIFDATEIFCGSEDRICRHVRWDRFMYSYTDHPSDYAAGIIGQNLNPFLESLAP